MTTLTVSIGRAIQGVPMTAKRWRAFRDDVSATLEAGGCSVHVTAARSTGVWDGVLEESATYVADVPEQQLLGVVGELRRLCGLHSQDAIACTIGTTLLLDPR